eukprot:CAMPEP_0172508552 /NCGR_PEP_ID=MMETSP1066-20121228/212856_1 /TAXON_ID=671091 /ORGANISM="Coscinodiscus wailesii, Strain CCMP2513" /LENGTH=250 /DNA_ID=CAMNT_0013286571 /DNA_START=162 /DNA_END=911 /DNA_ORIENTATION=-
MSNSSLTLEEPTPSNSNPPAAPLSSPNSSLTSNSSPPPSKSILRELLSTGFKSFSKTPSSAANTLSSSSQKGTLRPTPRAPINIIESSSAEQVSYFDLIETALRRDHNLTLRNIPYQNIRSGASGTIESLPIQCIRSGGKNPSKTAPPSSSSKSSSKQTATTTPNNPAPNNNASFLKSFLSYNDDTSPSAVIPPPILNNSVQPTEWHTGPYCHVYIAACENTDHYKSKIRPGLSAFVSQIESDAAAGGAG